MNVIVDILDAFFQFRAYVMLPIIILIIALIVRMRVKDALISVLQLAAGFAGIFIAFEFFIENINPAVKALATTRNLDLPILDVGWPPLAAITWASPVTHLSIPLIIVINIVMIWTKAVKTIYRHLELLALCPGRRPDLQHQQQHGSSAAGYRPDCRIHHQAQ